MAARAARGSDGGARPVVCERDGEGERRWERSRGFQGSGQRREDDARRRGVQVMQASRVVAWRARPRAPSASSAYWREEEGDRGGRRRWAGPAGGAGQLGRLQVSGPGGLLSFIFFVLFYFFFI